MKKNTFSKLFFKSSILRLRNFKGYVNPKSSVFLGFILVLIAFVLPEKMLSADIETPVSSEIFVSTGPSNVSLAPSDILNSESGGGLALFTKSFSPNIIDPGSVTTLTFTIDNTLSGESISDISFIDNLPAGLTIATPANVVSLCGGTLTAEDGGSTISLTGGSLGLGEICTISVDVTSITAGIHTNTSGDLTYVGANTGSNVVEGAIADLTVNTGLAGFSKAFFHDVQGLGGVTTLTFTIDNSLSGEDISSLNFTDNLPSGMTIATPANVVSSCGGIISAPNGGSAISYSGYGGVALGLGQICTISVDVTGSNVGVNTNTTEDFTYIGAISGSANAGNATADITVSEAVPGFSKVFSPNTIGPGSTTTLTFTIDNTSSGETISDISFIDNLPAGMTIATPANATNSCGLNGILTAPDGGTSISFSGGSLSLNEICTITVNVTTSTLGVSTNETGFLNYRGTNSGSAVAGNASADLNVVTTLPSFSKSFSPSTINAGERSRLTFTIDNSLNANAIGNLDFTDHLPDGMVVASPANLVYDCISAGQPNTTVTANSGSSTIVFDGNGFNFPGFEVLAAGASCTVSVDVIGTSAVDLNNVTEDLLADFVASGKASAILEINPRGELFIDKTFVTNPATPGGTTDLVYTIRNFSRDFTATNISFTDNLDAALSGLAGIGTPISACNGTLSGTSLLSFTGGSIAPGDSCTITVPLQIPGDALAGTYSSTTSVITGDIDGSPVTGNTTTETLFIQSLPTITKTFLNNPVAPGGTSILEFTITNTDPSNTLTDASFTDDLTDFLGYFPIGVSLPAAGSCGAGSTFTMTIPTTDQHVFVMTGGSIEPGSSCTFTIDIDILAGLPGGTYTNTTSSLSGVLDGVSVLGFPATDDLVVASVPRLRMSFTDDPVAAGGTVNLEFTLSYDELAVVDATDVGFTLDLASVLSGLTATGPVSGCGGTLATSVGDTFLTFSGGTLTPGEVCTFNIPVQVPAGAVPGVFPATTSALTATVGGLASAGNAAMDGLIIGGLTLTKEFIDNPVVPGALTTLRFTIDNATSLDADIDLFTDNLSDVLSGLVAEGLPITSSCGGTLSGTNFLIYTGGTVTAGSSCTFDVMVRVPAGATSGTYRNITSNLNVTLDGNPLILPPAIDDLVVDNNLIRLTKNFIGDLVTPGDDVTVEYTLENLDLTNAISDIAFTDDFGAALTGLSATGLPATFCGGTASGSSVLSFVGGSLPAGASCTFSVVLSTSVATPYGTSISSTTSAVTGTIGGLPILGDAASDILDFQYLVLSKSIAGPVAGGSTVITFTIENANPINSVSDLSFTDDLNAFIPGLVITDFPTSDSCGRLSEVSGTSTLLFANGSLGPGETCVFDVTVLLPCGTPDATYTNTTSEITGVSSTEEPLTSPAASGDLVVFGSVKTWNGTDWSPAGSPNLDSSVIINGDFQAGDLNDGNIEACSLTINPGFTLTIPATGYVQINGDITVDGNLFVEHEGSVVQIDDAALVANNGAITVEKITPFLEPRFFMISGSPMTAETREGVYANSRRVRRHVTANFVPNPFVAAEFPLANNFADDNGNNWFFHSGGINPGEGYAVWPQPSGSSSGSYTQNHTLGTLTNGVVDFPMTFNEPGPLPSDNQNASPNVLANPYASAIDADLFFDDPANANINVLYFWEHNTPALPSYPGYAARNWDMADISLYSESLGGLPAASGGDTPTQFISSGQGFAIKPSAGGTAQFNNSMRVTGPNDTYRSNNSVDLDRIWINVYNDAYELGSTALIGFTENTADEFINSEDIKRLATPVSIYSELESGEQLAINALHTFEVEDTFYLSFSTQVEEIQDYRISIDALEGLNIETATVYLIDALTGTVTNLTESDYTFQSGEATYGKRFEVVFENSVLGINGSNLESISLYPNPTQNVVTIVSPQTILTSATVYDIRGRKVSEVDFKNQTAYQIDLSSMEAAIYFIQIATENGTVMKQVMKK